MISMPLSLLPGQNYKKKKKISFWLMSYITSVEDLGLNPPEHHYSVLFDSILLRFFLHISIRNLPLDYVAFKPNEERVLRVDPERLCKVIDPVLIKRVLPSFSKFGV